MVCSRIAYSQVRKVRDVGDWEGVLRPDNAGGEGPCRSAGCTATKSSAHCAGGRLLEGHDCCPDECTLDRVLQQPSSTWVSNLKYVDDAQLRAELSGGRLGMACTYLSILLP